MKIRKASTDVSKQEYGGDFRRLYPWEGVANPPWGGAWMTIAPGQTSTPHNHDEEETFLILSGNGEMEVDGERRVIEKGDVIYLPRFSTHKLRNISSAMPLELLCIWWGAPIVD
ncbi:cupin domain-containing protein [Burkholderia sp. WSM2232]|uniref:cupin domain-containing protein n=1 Tax=Burkholderia sp. WSM2232 TaxID=944436 RepID=UPI0006873A7E|nr:cupin domain-containing protein [Burkholderia sp. WSM2232]